MANGIVEIRDYAFEELLRSAVETLRVESGGLIFGEKFETKKGLLWVVESAHPFQHANRFPTSFSVYSDGWRANWSVLNDYVGGFHLHPTSRVQKKGVRKTTKGRVSFSQSDKRFLKSEYFSDTLELIIGMRQVDRPGNVSNSNPLLVAGYIPIRNRLYRAEVGGYYYDHGIRRAEICVSKKILRKIQNPEI